MEWNDAPDFIEPIYAARAWSVNGPRLSAVGFPVRKWWPNFPAICIYNLHPDEISPKSSCNCGYWGVVSPEYLRSVFWADNVSYFGQARYVTGIVKMWGKVIVGSHGFRSQFAEPVAMVYDEHINLLLRATKRKLAKCYIYDDYCSCVGCIRIKDQFKDFVDIDSHRLNRHEEITRRYNIPLLKEWPGEGHKFAITSPESLLHA